MEEKPKIRLPSIKKEHIEYAIQELSFWVGLTMFSTGLYLIYPPMMYIIVGAGLIWFSLPGKKVDK